MMVDADKLLEQIERMAKVAEQFAKAKSDRVHLEQYRKSLKAILMSESGAPHANAREQEAYSAQRYIDHLEALRQAVEVEERLKWKLDALKLLVEIWRSHQANTRFAQERV